MSNGRWQLITFPRLDCSSVTKLPILVNEIAEFRKSIVGATGRFIKQTTTSLLLDFIAHEPDLFTHSTIMKNVRIDVGVVALGNEEHDHSNIGFLTLQLFVQMSERFQCKIKSFVLVFVTARCKKINRL